MVEQVKIWNNLDGKWTPVKVLKTAEAATAVAFSPTDFDQRSEGPQKDQISVLILHRRRVAIGLENGHILIYSSACTKLSEWGLELAIDSSYDPHLTTSFTHH